MDWIIEGFFHGAIAVLVFAGIKRMIEKWKKITKKK